MAREYPLSRGQIGMRVVRLSAPPDDDPDVDDWYESTIQFCDERLDDSDNDRDREKAYYIGLAARLEARRVRQARRPR